MPQSRWAELFMREKTFHSLAPHLVSCIHKGTDILCTFSTILSIAEIWKLRDFCFRNISGFLRTVPSPPGAFPFFCTPQLLTLPALPWAWPAVICPSGLMQHPCLLGGRRVTEHLLWAVSLWKRGRDWFFITCLHSTWQIRYSVGAY